ncbi:hypothetical protein BC828DRAFT_50407 [Blastocladiella britannica]|nr:hypothetical protein BC828DRAFT_50407 [Blastocladiella britannica]
MVSLSLYKVLASVAPQTHSFNSKEIICQHRLCLPPTPPPRSSTCHQFPSPPPPLQTGLYPWSALGPPPPCAPPLLPLPLPRLCVRAHIHYITPQSTHPILTVRNSNARTAQANMFDVLLSRVVIFFELVFAVTLASLSIAATIAAKNAPETTTNPSGGPLPSPQNPCSLRFSASLTMAIATCGITLTVLWRELSRCVLGEMGPIRARHIDGYLAYFFSGRFG